MTQASDLAAELDAEINDLAAAVSATSNPNPLVTEVLDRMRATSAQLASVKADSKPEHTSEVIPSPPPLARPDIMVSAEFGKDHPAPDPRASRL